MLQRCKNSLNEDIIKVILWGFLGGLLLVSTYTIDKNVVFFLKKNFNIFLCSLHISQKIGSLTLRIDT